MVKVNNKIMNPNFLHLQDGSGDVAVGSNSLVVTSKQTSKISDQISIAGVVILSRDFGCGYSYPLLIEDTSITSHK